VHRQQGRGIDQNRCGFDRLSGIAGYDDQEDGAYERKPYANRTYDSICQQLFPIVVPGQPRRKAVRLHERTNHGEATARTRLCSAGRHDRAIGVTRILHDEVDGSPPRRDTRFVGNMGAAFS
jgi:hypothetical protein